MGSLTFRRQESLIERNQTGHNKNEVARPYTDHLDGPKLLKDGRVLGLTVTRAIGNSKWKCSRRVQEEEQRRFFGPQPYLTALPVETTTKTEPENGDFLVMASDSLWDHLTNQQTVELVS